MFQGLGLEDIENMELVEHTLALYLWRIQAFWP